MTKYRNTSHKQTRTRQGGFAMLLVIIMVGVAFVMGMSYLNARSTSTSIMENKRRQSMARYIAESGADMAVEEVKRNADWRTDFSSGKWVTNHALAGGTVTIMGVDEADGNLADDETDKLTLTSTGTFEGVSYVATALVTATNGASNEGDYTVGDEAEGASSEKGVANTQIASLATLSKDSTITSISAWVKGPPPKEARFAIYSDNNGEPGALIVQSSTIAMSDNSSQFYLFTAALPPTPLTAGTYWLALSYEHSNQHYKYNNGTGQTRMLNNDAVRNGFVNNWGTSTASYTRSVSIFASGFDTEGPLAHWTFDDGSGNTVTESIQGLNGTRTNGPTWGTGTIDGGMHFDGVNDYVSVPATSLLDVTSDATITGWFKLDENFNGASANTQIIISKMIDDNRNLTIALVGLDYNSAIDKGSMLFKIENGSDGLHYRYVFTNKKSWLAGVWYHFVVVLDATDHSQNSIAVDGVDDTSSLSGVATSVSINLNYNADWYFGGKNADSVQITGERFFKGTLDDIRIYNRKLDETEIENLYETGETEPGDSVYKVMWTNQP